MKTPSPRCNTETMRETVIIKLAETDSTNRFLRDYRGETGLRMTVATAEHQTAGRGQGGNTWESEGGRNILLSVMTHPQGLAARRQFVMLEAGALAVRDTLTLHADGFSIKWPNDIYWHDMKISGTLSECDISRGMVGRCILGTGININQRTFTGSAPNPVSLWQITGQETDRNQITDELLKRLEHYLDMVDTGRYGDIHDMYAGSLYRRNGVHAYRDAGGVFMARIERIEPDGRLVLHRTDGSLKEYMFKEVEHIITPCPTTTRQ